MSDETGMRNRELIARHTLTVLEFQQVREILASYASSVLGRDAALKVEPCCELEGVGEALAQTSEMKGILERQIRMPLAGLRDIRPLLEKKVTWFGPGELLEIATTLAAGLTIRKFFETIELELPHLAGLAGQLMGFEDLTESINCCIDPDEKIRDDASERLKELRREIEQLNGEIHRQFQKIVSSANLRSALENDKFVTRNNRPVLAVKKNYRSWVRGIVLDRSNTGATLYIEPPELIELANQLEEVLFEERKEINRILWELTRAVFARREDIVHSVNLLARIDLTYAQARFSIAYRMNAPSMVKDSFVRLRRARHPLLIHLATQGGQVEPAEAGKQVVPIDVRLGDDFDMLILTGPNTGGKTVTLKTIGLLVLMAQSGMHIPAGADSHLPVFGQIHADIGDEQSLQQSLSTFSAHMSQIAHILDKADSRSLVLLDELGSGTDPAEGAALGSAILDRLRQSQALTVATTHLGHLKNYAYTAARVANGSVEFDMRTLRPTFRLLIGQPGSSNALTIAARLGMPQPLIDRAKSLLSEEASQNTELLNRVQAARIDAERSRAEAERLHEKGRELHAAARGALHEARQQQAAALHQADQEIDKSMTEVRGIAARFLKDMQNAPKPWAQRAGEFAREIERAAESTTLAQRRARFVESVRTGDRVGVATLNRHGTVLRIRRQRRLMTLSVEGKQVEVPFSQIIELKGT